MTHDELVALEHENWIAYLTGVVSKMGRPIYERLGFRTVVRYAAYVDAAPGI